jgi:hypothetical protein
MEVAMQEDRAEIRRQLGWDLVATKALVNQTDVLHREERKHADLPAERGQERNVERERTLTAEQDRNAIRVSSLAEVDAAIRANPGRVVIVCSGKVLNHRAEAD